MSVEIEINEIFNLLKFALYLEAKFGEYPKMTISPSKQQSTSE